ncbi:hypothetical protein V6N11_079312 [Hibiscus sabdariffa]|uniref:Pentatricopeptide repeat-containing protein n=1 Tax=Hibiscus sabdariffa TaxID=183260 RepID=A0ABR2RVQ6_9ROSI
MGKLISSVILPTIVNCSNSRSSSSFKTIATHGKALSKNSMSVSGKPKKFDRFDNVGAALTVFNKMIGKYPKPSIVEFNKLLGAIVRMKHYAIVVSMYSRLEIVGISHYAYSLSILTNCFCQLGQIDFGFSVLGKMLKLGV